ncbi:translin-associated factor X-interacting protein 1 isoform X2 [Hemicordylus capensis]|nr:translin-associated factor X-interacting protein 1 isoform X2 [Hemicordylus capensis]XP_053126570.1 translin-associated factor X-interacting protein 1 isoform X2 [Hemicordylus capensis]XP_053126571.1 translin-associated factor X-interacting protein 1 isoform X2 [Hemicordylus capensis]
MILQNRKPCSFPEWQSTSKEQIAASVAKPRYLEELECHLRKELQSLDLTKGKVQELRLQPYREVFEFFMEEFRTYKPLLASIKNEYELTIAHLKEKIRSLESVNVILATASDQYTRQVLALQEQEKIEITELKKDRIYLLKLIDKMREEKCSLETQVSKMRKTVAAEYLRYLSECDARKLLLIDLNEMYRQKEEMKLATTVLEHEGKGEDSVKVTLALKMARQDLTKAQVELNTLKANYGDVVPRRDFETQEQKNHELSEKMQILQKDFEELQEEYDTMLEIHKQVSEERDQFYNDFLDVQRSSTPRPYWGKCAEVIPGGVERWQTLSKGKTSDQLVDVLLEDLGAALLREKDTFVALGRSEKVPVFLRCDGMVRNKKLTKKEVVAILREIWKEKMTIDLQKGRRTSLSEFFLNFFQRRYGDAIAFDWTYTIFENIKLFRTNETMSLFYRILIGNLDEGVYHSHLQQLTSLLRELSIVDSSNTGQLTSEQFSVALKSAFPSKTEEQIQELTESAGYKLENPEDLVMYKLLFLEDEEGKTEPLIAKLKKQYNNDKKSYLRELRAELGTLEEVRPDDLRAAFVILDPGLAEHILDTYISLAFQTSKDQLDPAGSVPLETVMQRLKAGDIKRQGIPVQTEPKHTIPIAEESEVT